MVTPFRSKASTLLVIISEFQAPNYACCDESFVLCDTLNYTKHITGPVKYFLEAHHFYSLAVFFRVAEAKERGTEHAPLVYSFGYPNPQSWMS
jgi:hypothetical protein